MHTRILFLLIFIFRITICNSQTPYKIKSCKIDSYFSNGFQKGKKSLIFTDSGKIEKLYTVVNTDTTIDIGIPKEYSRGKAVDHHLLIQRTDSVFSIDLDKMIGYKKARFYIDFSSFIENKKKKIGEDTILNRSCDIIEINGIKIWYWKGIALKTELLVGHVYEYATSIDENYIIKEDEFKLPKGVKIE